MEPVRDAPSSRPLTMPCSVVLAATIFTPSINGTARRSGSLGKDPPGAPLISLSPAPPIQGQHSQP